MKTIKWSGMKAVIKPAEDNKSNVPADLEGKLRTEGRTFNLSEVVKAIRGSDRQFSVAVKLGVPVMAFAVAAATLLGINAMNATRDRLKDSYTERVRQLALVVQAEFQSHPDDPAHIGAFLQNLEKSEPLVERIHIYRSSDREIERWATTNPREFSKDFYAKKDSIETLLKDIPRENEKTDPPELEIYLPVKVNERLIGAVEMYATLKPAKEAEAIATQSILLATALGVAVPIGAFALLFYCAISQQLTKQNCATTEDHYALAVKGANDGLWDWNLQTNAIYFSSRWKSMLGYEETEIGNKPDEWLNRIHPEDFNRVKIEISSHLEGATPNFESEYRLLHKDGTYRWILCRGLAFRDENQNICRIAGSAIDITGRKVLEDQLIHDAFHDPLTGLSNRALFTNRLEHAFELTKRRPNYLFAVLFLDLDRFKVVNDSLGHAVGDRLLIELVQRLLPGIRSGDTLARLGGDEFAILLEDIHHISDATAIADRIQKQLELPFNLNGYEVFTSASIGIALSAADYNSPEELLRDADLAMYRAKSQGKARHQVFDPAMHVQAVTLLQIENDLRRAIDGCEFQIHYQPLVSLETGCFTGFEALVRWKHFSKGIISPAEFIPIAEETGLIVPIGYWVIREACRQMYVWQQLFPANPPLTINVNLSGKQFSQKDLIPQIVSILQETGFSARSLNLEITESAFGENPDAASTLLDLKHLGVQLYIDEFGTGASSLSFMHRFPFDALKIARCFISTIEKDDESLKIVQAIVTLARNLGIRVVAEGVETAKQLEHLQEIGCKDGQGQGYFFSKPLNRESVEVLMSKALERRRRG